MDRQQRQAERLKERDAIMGWMRKNGPNMSLEEMLHHINRGAHRVIGDMED